MAADHIFRRVPGIATGLAQDHDQDIADGKTPEEAMLRALDRAFGIYRDEVAGEVRAMTDVPGAAEIADRLAPPWRRPDEKTG